MNKKIIIILFAILFSTQINSQKVTLSVDSSNTNSTRIDYQYFDINKFEQRTVFKVGAFADLPQGISSFPFNVASIEHKLSKPVSLELLFYSENRKHLSAKVRYYPNKRADRGVNNISGNYLALELAKDIGGSSPFGTNYLGSGNTLMLQFGKQVKSGNYGFTDFNLYINRQFGGFNNSLNIGFNALVGAGWGKTKKSYFAENENNHKDFLKNGKFLFSVQNPSLRLGEYFTSASISMGIETMLFNGFTLNAVLLMQSSEQSTNSDPFFRISSRYYGLSTELRKYLFINTRLQKGKTVNSFAGTYVAVGTDHILSNEKTDILIDGTSEKYHYNGIERVTPYLGIGYQERVDKRLFFDIYGRYYPFQRNIFTSQKHPPSFTFGAKIGLYWLR